MTSWEPRPTGEHTYAPGSVAPWTCPECGAPASVGLRVGDLVNVRCETHGTWYAVAPFSFTQQELLSAPPRAPRMNPEARLWFLHAAAKVMLNAPARAFLVIEVQGHPCEYEIIDREPGHELGLQVGCREWDCPHCGNQPLPDEAIAKLRTLGFAPAAPHLNAWRQHLPYVSRDLAILFEQAFLAAYEPPLDFEIALYASTPQDYARLVDELS